MSEVLNQLTRCQLRKSMFPQLPEDVQNMFPTIGDPVFGDGPNIVSGHLSELGTQTGFPLITISSKGTLEGLTAGKYRHLSLYVDHWVSANQAQDPAARRVAQILYEYSSKALQDINFSAKVGNVSCAVHRCYEIDCSDILYEEQSKLNHIAVVYRVEAVADAWY